ncbi:MAG TPA: dipeptidyl aminopeptidase, partial [Chloroflexi bacterium]|nr:dipeptidyl aminopeptidase [Chloroflexota bacterium]
VLFLQAETDWRCPIEQGEQLYTALRARGVPAEMVRFPGESHGQLAQGKPRTRLVRRQVTWDWMKGYLEG